MKKVINDNILYFIIIILCVFLTSIGTSYAAILFAASDVSYNNSTSGISSTKVQDAIDELYGKATTYTSLQSRTTSIEDALSPMGTQYPTTYYSNKEIGHLPTGGSYYTIPLASITDLPAGSYFVWGTVEGNSNGYTSIFISKASDCSTNLGYLTYEQKLESTYLSSIQERTETSTSSYYVCMKAKNTGVNIRNVIGVITAVRVK